MYTFVKLKFCYQYTRYIIISNTLRPLIFFIVIANVRQIGNYVRSSTNGNSLMWLMFNIILLISALFPVMILKNKVFLFPSCHLFFSSLSLLLLFSFFSPIFYSILTFILILSFIFQLPIYDKKDEDFLLEYDKKSELPLIKEISSIRLQISGIVSYLSVSKYSNIIYS